MSIEFEYPDRKRPWQTRSGLNVLQPVKLSFEDERPRAVKRHIGRPKQIVDHDGHARFITGNTDPGQAPAAFRDEERVPVDDSDAVRPPKLPVQTQLVDLPAGKVDAKQLAGIVLGDDQPPLQNSYATQVEAFAGKALIDRERCQLVCPRVQDQNSRHEGIRHEDPAVFGDRQIVAKPAAGQRPPENKISFRDIECQEGGTAFGRMTGLGCKGIRVESPNDLAAAYRAALDNREGPTLIDVVVTRDAARCCPASTTARPPIKKGDRIA